MPLARHNKKSKVPGSAGNFVISLREVDVGEDVILTEAVIARALAAIAELQVGIIRIRAAADGALVVIALLLFLPLLLLCGPLELHRLGPVAIGGAVGHVVYLRPDEHGKVQQGDHRQKRAAPVARHQAAHHIEGEQRRVHIGQPLHLDGNDEKQQHLRIREQEREGEEHGQVHIVGARHGVALAGDEAGDQHAHRRQQYAADVVEVELGGAPLALQRGADPVVEIQADQQPEDAAAGGHKHIGKDAPQLALQHSGGIQRQKRQRVGVVGLREHHQNIHDDVAGHDVEHQIGDAETGVPCAEALHRVIEFFQERFLLLV